MTSPLLALHGIHAIQTGSVAVKVPSFTREGGAIASKLRILTSRTFTPKLPIFCWLVEHEEGDFLIDAGMSEEASRSDYLDTLGPLDAWLHRRVSRFAIAPGEGLGPQLQRIRRMSARGLRAVLTHLHVDHVGGLADLPGCEAYVNQAEWRHPYAAPKRLLAAVRPHCFTLKPDPALPFGASFPLTRAGDLLAVATPGHTPHHCAVILRRGGVTFFFAGDVVYTREQLLRGTLAGAHACAGQAAASIRAIRDFARSELCLFLPSHDLPGLLDSSDFTAK